MGRARGTEAIQRLLGLLRTELCADACVLFTWGAADERLARVLAEVIRDKLTERPQCRSAGR